MKPHLLYWRLLKLHEYFERICSRYVGRQAMLMQEKDDKWKPEYAYWKFYLAAKIEWELRGFIELVKPIFK